MIQLGLMPDIDPVQAGDLITAQDVNEMITAINELKTRVADLKARVQELEKKTGQVEEPFANLPGIDFGKAFRLRTEGIQNLEALSQKDPQTVKEILGVGDNEATILLENVNNLLGVSGP